MTKLPAGWQMKSLGEIVKLSKGKKPNVLLQVKTAQSSRFIQIDDLRNDNNIKYTDDTVGVRVNERDVLVAWDGANAGTVGYGLNGYIGSTLARLAIVASNISTHYLGSFLRTKSKELRSNCTGATIPHLSKSFLLNIQIPLPPLPIQKQIAEILERADKARQKRKEANKLTDQFLQSVFIDMFGDPVSNPKGWKTGLLSDHSILITKGETPLWKGETYQKEGILFLRSENILNMHIALKKKTFISQELHNKMKRSHVKNNDVLLNIVGASIGRSAIYIHNYPANINQAIAIIRLKSTIHPIFLCHYLNSDFAKNMYLDIQAGVARDNLSLTQIRNFDIPLPPIQIQQNYANIVQKTEALRTKHKESETELDELFNSLMQKAFTGELVS